MASKRLAPTGSTLDALTGEVSALCAEIRLDAAISKAGRLEADDAARLVEVALVVDELTSELDASHDAVMISLTTQERAMLGAFVQDEARALVELHAEARRRGL